jgi:hypothetical protein
MSMIWKMRQKLRPIPAETSGRAVKMKRRRTTWKVTMKMRKM